MNARPGREALHHDKRALACVGEREGTTGHATTGEESFFAVCADKLETMKLTIQIAQRQHQCVAILTQFAICVGLLCLQVGMRFNWFRTQQYPRGDFWPLSFA